MIYIYLSNERCCRKLTDFSGLQWGHPKGPASSSVPSPSDTCSGSPFLGRSEGDCLLPSALPLSLCLNTCHSVPNLKKTHISTAAAETSLQCLKQLRRVKILNYLKTAV